MVNRVSKAILLSFCGALYCGSIFGEQSNNLHSYKDWRAEQTEQQATDTIPYSLSIDEVTIRSTTTFNSHELEHNGKIDKLEFEQIGARVVEIDSGILRNNISTSLAEMLSIGSTVFIKSYGRATLSTASVRGAAPSHTKVLWNGMNITSPMLGMVDFSLIPSYFTDKVGVYRGAASVKMSGGGFGGGISLSTNPNDIDGFSAQLVQGIGSFSTFDSFLRINYGSSKLKGATRVYRASSKNNFSYLNRRRKLYIKDDSGKVIESYYPTERNRNGNFNDFHLLQEIYYSSKEGSLWSGTVWLTESKRGIPMLSVDYRDENRSSNRQTENSIRGTIKWEKQIGGAVIAAQVGYNGSSYHYTYMQDIGTESLTEMINAHSKIGTTFLSGNAEWKNVSRWEFAASVALYNHSVTSEDRAVVGADGKKTTIGYAKNRVESSTILSAKYSVNERIGIALDLRGESYGNSLIPPIPALFIDWLVDKRGAITIKASYARNYRFPTLNDLYFIPGGNDSLSVERGHTFDVGSSFKIDKNGKSIFEGSLSLFDSWIKDWILWLPTQKGFWSPINVKRVNSYGAELIAKGNVELFNDCSLIVDANFAITHSVNRGKPLNSLDNSVGKQLVYIPIYSGAMNGTFRYKKWAATYRWNWYSERFTASDNSYSTHLNVLGAYFMNDLSVLRTINTSYGSFEIKLQINNLFNRAYESVLSHPMAGRNYGLFIEYRF